MPSHQHGWGFDITSDDNNETMWFGGVDVTYGESAYSGTVYVTPTGGGGPHNILAPVSVVNWFIVHG